jgi:hypothetical protein
MRADARAQAESYVQRAALMWIGAVQPISRRALTSKVTIVNADAQVDSGTGQTSGSGGCAGTNGQVNFRDYIGQAPRTGAHVYMMATAPIMEVVPAYAGRLSTYAHEFGHMFGLKDTYINGGHSGDCMPDQPTSMMCDPYRFSGLQQDDIDGIRSLFRTVHPDAVNEQH